MPNSANIAHEARIMDALGCAVIATDLEGTIVYWNRAAEELYGWAAEETIGENVLARAPMRSSQARAAEMIARRRDGTEFIAWMTDAPVFDSRGALIGAIRLSGDIAAPASRIAHLANDVAALIQARAAAERDAERAARLQSVTAALAGAVTPREVADTILTHALETVGARSGSVYVIDRAGTKLTIAGSHAFPQSLLDDYTTVSLSSGLVVATAARTGVAQWIPSIADALGQYPHLRRIANDYGHEAVAVLPLAVGDRILGSIAFLFPEPRPFSESERLFLLAIAAQCSLALERARLYDAELHARAEAEGARSAAEAASHAKSAFLATMSHELRTPLNAIVGHVQLVDMGVHGPVTEAQHEALQRVNRAHGHLMRLINDVLDLARVESGQVAYELVPIRVADIVADIASLVGPQFREKHIRFTPRLPQGVRVRADRERLVQILTNLLGNAAKFTPAGGHVELVCTTPPDTPTLALLQVTDTGPGIPWEKLESIFEPFVQLECTASEQGTGLGLAISRDLARGMGGDLRVTSVVGVGTTFTLALPLA